jgi:MFS family permease
MAKTKINKIVATLIKADIISLSALGLTSPIFAIFITSQIKGGDVKVVGFSAAVYWIIKALIEIIFGKVLDKTKGEKDDFYFLFFGYVVVGICCFAYIFATLPWHIYVLQAVFGIGMAMTLPSWCAIFTRHIDKGREAFEWSLQSSSVGLGTGITGAVGGILVSSLGFYALFVIVGILVIAGDLLLLAIYRDIVKKNKGFWPFTKSRSPF